MNKLNENSSLFLELFNNPPSWWKLITSYDDVYADIRKDNTIDIYYNGGCIITGLRRKNNRFYGSIHYKYLLPERSTYLNYDMTDGNLRLPDIKPQLLFGQMDAKILKRIKDNIKNVLPATSEKGIQGRFITQKSTCFLDSEFAYKTSKNVIRIDLVWIDIGNRKIIFIELKTIDDSRLYDNRICRQLSEYNNFLNENQSNLLDYYKKIFLIKKKLSLIKGSLNTLESLNDFDVAKKPLLLLGNCTNDWIKLNSDKINDRVRDIALGAYYFGSPNNCDIIKKSSSNRYIFNES